MWTVLGVPHPTHPADCWPWFRVVCSIIHMLHEAASIEDVWDGVRSSAPVNTVATRQPTDTENQACLIGIFSVLCWGSITLQPILSWDDLGPTPRLLVRQPSQSQTGDHHQHGLRMDIVRRPIHAIFRNFRKTMSTTRWRQPIGGSSASDSAKCYHCANESTNTEESTVLFTSTLNYDSLKTIGKIRLRWVDDLSSHLDFDSQNRSLSVFRFPSLCALGALEKSRGPIFDG